MKKTIISVFLSVVMVAALTGCGGSAKPANDNVNKSEETGLKIAIVTSLTGVDDGSFHEENYKGILSFIDAHPGSTVTPVQETSGAIDAAVKAVGDIVVDYDVMVCDGYQFAGIGEIAADNPDKKFILVDSFPTDADGKEVELDNVYAMTFKEQEAGFLAGMAAALSSDTKKVAVVNGIAVESNVNYQYGFMSGVNYANKHYDTGVEIVELASYAGTDMTGANVGGNYVGSFGDPAMARLLVMLLSKKAVISSSLLPVVREREFSQQLRKALKRII